jgi:hypothetical protein
LASDEQVVNAVTALILPGEKEHDHRRSRYDHSYEVYRASRPATGIEPWQSKLRVKYGMQVIDTALVNIVSGEPKVKVTGRGPEDELGAKGMQAVFDYHIRHDHLVERRPVFAQQGLIYGVTAAKNHWIYKTGRRVKKTWTRDQLTGALLAARRRLMWLTGTARRSSR